MEDDRSSGAIRLAPERLALFARTADTILMAMEQRESDIGLAQVQLVPDTAVHEEAHDDQAEEPSLEALIQAVLLNSTIDALEALQPQD